MITEKNALFIFVMLFITAVFVSGCVSGGFSEDDVEKSKNSGIDEEINSEESKELYSDADSDENFVEEQISDSASSGNGNNIDSAEKEGDLNSDLNPNPNPEFYHPLWVAGTVASDTDKKSFCLITKMDFNASEYYILNLMSPPAGGYYVYKDSSFEGMGKKYPAEDIDEKYSNFIGTALSIPVYAKGSSTSIVAFLENDTTESMYMNKNLIE